MKELIHSHINRMSPYIPGFQPHSGSRPFIKLNTNESPFPPSRKVILSLKKALKQNKLHLYPDPSCIQLRRVIGNKFDLPSENVMITNGSDEALSLLFRSVLSSKSSLIIQEPTYSLYPVLAKINDASCISVPLQADWKINFSRLIQAVNTGSIPHKNSKADQKQKKPPPPIHLAVIANPNSPTGIAESVKQILGFAKENPSLTLVDEAYLPFMGSRWTDFSAGKYAGTKDFPRLTVCGSFSKAYSLAGQRVGWLLAHPDLIRSLDKIRDSYNLSGLAQEAALAAWKDEKGFLHTINRICRNRKKLNSELDKLGFHTLPSSANFIFTRPPLGLTARDYNSFLTSKDIFVRYFDQKRVSDYVRITIGTKKDMKRLLNTTKGWINLCKKKVQK